MVPKLTGPGGGSSYPVEGSPGRCHFLSASAAAHILRAAGRASPMLFDCQFDAVPPPGLQTAIAERQTKLAQCAQRVNIRQTLGENEGGYSDKLEHNASEFYRWNFPRFPPFAIARARGSRAPECS